jgi:cell pole-organizing protein PopZ
MPSRLPAAPAAPGAENAANGAQHNGATHLGSPLNGSSHNGSHLNGSALNGGALGQSSVNGAHPAVIGLRSHTMPGADSMKPSPAPVARAVEPAETEYKLPDDPSVLFKPQPIVHVDLDEADDEAPAFNLDEPVAEKPMAPLAPSSSSVLSSAALFAASSQPAKAATASPTASIEPAETEPVSAAAAAAAASSGPSETLVDAVMEMVHAQPETLSVFTSGANFIHGARKLAAEAAAKAGSGPGGPKIDGAAAELLRPMLRQWLADNMPRIVEDALRSELMSAPAPAASAPVPKKS